MRVLAAIGFLFVLATLTPIDGLWITALSGPWNNPKGEVLVVLGADAVPDVIGWTSYWRSVYAVRAWREGGFWAVVTCGGAIKGEVPVAERMGDFLVSQGIPAKAIRVEGQSRSTRENALKSKVILDTLTGRKVLMTSDYHMYRAYRTFRKAGIPVEPRPIPDASKQLSEWRYRFPVFIGLCVETAKIAYYTVRGWI
jgi:uncharacterized SAM-binding protein YcdF (DUF218 family)